MLILVDMDGVLADFELAFLTEFSRRAPGAPAVPLTERRNFYVRDDYPRQWHSLIHSIHGSEGFFRRLPPIPGALVAMEEMLSAGHDVRICTSPLTSNEFCASEKMGWVKEHLGRTWLRRTIITSDKTLVRGDVLVDDRPTITGAMTPTWEHVVFAAAYNATSPARRLEDWTQWKSVLTH